MKYNWSMILLLIIFVTGCVKETEVPLKNIQLLAAIRTAVSIESTEQLEKCHSTLQAEKDANNIPLALQEELKLVIELGTKGEWKDAQEKIQSIQKRYTVDSTTVRQEGHQHTKASGHKHK